MLFLLSIQVLCYVCSQGIFKGITLRSIESIFLRDLYPSLPTCLFHTLYLAEYLYLSGLSLVKIG
nr:MAG TPA: hypothetical protein [Caudoviricetes sp.]